MKKYVRVLSVAVVMLLACIVALPQATYAASTQAHKLNDYGEYIWDDNEAKYETKLQNLSDKYGFDVVVFTDYAIPDDYYDTSSMTKSFQYADDLYVYGWGYDGESFSSEGGIVLLLTKEDRSWAIDSLYNAQDAIDPDGADYIFSQMQSDLADDNYESALDEFIDTVDIYLQAYSEGKPYRGKNTPVTAGDWLLWGAIVIIGGLIIGLIRGSSLKSQLKSVAIKTEANNYVVQGSFNLKNSRDFFLYRTVTRVKRESSSGGSSHSSSGHSSGSSGHY